MNLIQRIYRLLVNVKQKTNRLFCLVIATLAAIIGINPSANADILRVDSGIGTCPGDGILWSTAYKGRRRCQTPTTANEGV